MALFDVTSFTDSGKVFHQSFICLDFLGSLKFQFFSFFEIYD